MKRYTSQNGHTEIISYNSVRYTKLDGSGKALADDADSWMMVRDNVTGLIWEMKTDDDTIHDIKNCYTWYDINPATNGGNTGTPEDGNNTENFIKALNGADYGGYSDWRLPTHEELCTIVIEGMPSPGPTIDTDYFPNISSFYWSSTTYMDHTSRAMGVFFPNGYSNNRIKRFSYYVRAVRGERSQSAYVDNGNSTVTDKSTGLMWQQNEHDAMTWEQALSYCENSTLASYTDWRLPTLDELKGIVDYSRMPTINP